MYRDNVEKFVVFGVTVLMLLIIFFDVGVNSCTSHEFENGIVADKYRGRYGTPRLIIEKNGDYGDVTVTEEDYFEYDIGEIYAQE